MKNFKLLMATTAILATEAIIANATDPSVNMNVGVNIHRASTFEKTADMNFGSIIIPDSAKELHITMNIDGIVTAADESETVQSLDDAGVGETSGVPCGLLSYPSEVELNTGPASEYTITGSAKNIVASGNAAGISTDRCFFFGDLDITSTGPLESGIYMGHFTITAVYPE